MLFMYILTETLDLEERNETLNFINANSLNTTSGSTAPNNAIENSDEIYFSGGVDTTTKVTWYGVFDKPKKISGLNIEFTIAPKYINIYTCTDDTDDRSCILQSSQYAVVDLAERIKPNPDNMELEYTTVQDDKATFLPTKKSITVNFFPEFTKKIQIEMWGYNVYARVKNFLAQSGGNEMKEMGYVAMRFVQPYNNYIDVMIKSKYLNAAADKCITVPKKSNKEKFLPNQKLEVDTCLQALYLADGREIFIMGNDGIIESKVVKNQCLSVQSVRNNEPVVLAGCQDNNYRNNFEFTSQGQFKIRMTTQVKCIGLNTDGYNYVDDSSTIVEKSSTKPVLASTPSTPSASNPFGFASSPATLDLGPFPWKGELRRERDVITVNFGENLYPIKKVYIEFSEYAEDFEIIATNKFGESTTLCKEDWYYPTLDAQTQERKANYTCELKDQEIYSKVDIRLNKKGPNFDNYGVKKLIITSGGAGMVLQDCPSSDEGDVTLYEFGITSIMNLKNVEKSKYLVFNYQNLFDLYLQSKSVLQSSKAKEFKTLAKQVKLIFNKMNNSDQTVDRKLSENSLEKSRVLLGVSDVGGISSDEALNPLGTSKNPALSCEDVKTKYPSKRSGYYYVKSECMPVAIKVYCDLETAPYFDYVFYNMNLDKGEIITGDSLKNAINKNVFETDKDVKHLCANIGLKPLKLTEYDQFITLMSVLLDQNYDINNNKFIPVAYDYRCDTADGCSKKYNSLDSSLTDDSNLYTNIKKLYMSINQVNDIKFQTDKPNVLGFYNEKLEFFELSKQASIQAIICSSNPKVNTKIDYIQLTCTSNLNSNKDIATASDGSVFTVSCPAYCTGIDIPLYGIGQYHSASSICKAGIHSGAIDESGGKMNLKIGQAPKNGFSSEVQNNILSHDKAKGDEQIAFSLENISPVCPIDELKSLYGITSFMQTTMEAALNDMRLSNSYDSDSEQIRSDQNDLSENTVDYEEGNLINKNSENNGIEQGNDYNGSKNSDSNQNSNLNDESDLLDSAESNLVEENTESTDQYKQIQKKEDRRPYSYNYRQNEMNNENDNKIISEESQEEFDDSFKQMQYDPKHTHSNPSIKNKMRFVQQDLLAGLSPTQNEFLSKQTTSYYKLFLTGPLFDKIKELIKSKTTQQGVLEGYRKQEKLSHHNMESNSVISELTTLHTKLFTKTNDLQKEVNSLKLMAIARISYELNKEKELRMEIEKLEFQKPYTEGLDLPSNYTDQDPKPNKILTKYRTYDYGSPIDGYQTKSNWNVVRIVDRHLNKIAVLTNNSNIHNNLYPEQIGSRLILRKRDMYDFNLYVGISHVTQLAEVNQAGIIFRFKDHSNYYGVEIKHRNITLFKVTKGIYIKIDNLKLLNIFDNQNFVFVKVVADKNNIKVFLKKNCVFLVNDNEQKVVGIRTRADNEEICQTDSADMIFDILDNDHYRGKFGFFSDNSTQLMVNYFSVSPLMCTPILSDIKKFVYSLNCSRWDYAMSVGGFKNNWSVLDDMMVVDKIPSRWREIKDLGFKFNKGVVQEANLVTSNGAIATWLFLNDARVCKDGNFFTNFKIDDEGKLAFVFRRQDNNRFWYIELDIKKSRMAPKKESNDKNKDSNLQSKDNDNDKDREKYLVKINLKRRVLNQFNEPMEKFLASEDAKTELFTIEFGKWNQVSIDFVGPVVKVFMSQEFFGLQEVFKYELSTEEQADSWRTGSVGFGTYSLKGFAAAGMKTFPHYTNLIRPKPSLDPPGAPGSKSGGDDDKKKAEEKEEIKYELSIEEQVYRPNPNGHKDLTLMDDLNFAKCYNLRTTSDRGTYCSGQSIDAAVHKCNEDYCSYCCKTNLANHEYSFKLFNCLKTCNDNTKQETDTGIIKNCVEPEDITKTMYNYCLNSKVGHEQVSCMRDMCDMCCASANMLSGKKYENLIIQRCSFSCWRKFKVKN